MNSSIMYYTEYVRDDLHPKYIMTDMTKEFDGRILHRIKSVSDFAFAQYGELGGWIEKEENLSQFGDCWVSEGGMVYGDAKVSGNARVYGNAKVFCNAQVYGNSIIMGNS